MNLESPNGHILKAQFGLEGVAKPGQLDRLVRELPAVRPAAAEQLTRIAYQTEYGIYDHSTANGGRPLADLALHPKLNAFEGGSQLSYIRRFYNYRMPQLFNLTLEQFFAMEYPIARFHLELAESAVTFKDRSTKELERDLSKQLELDL